MLATVAAADSASTVREKYRVYIYSEAEPHAMYAIYKQTRKLCSTVFHFHVQRYVQYIYKAFWMMQYKTCLPFYFKHETCFFYLLVTIYQL